MSMKCKRSKVGENVYKTFKHDLYEDHRSVRYSLKR